MQKLIFSGLIYLTMATSSWAQESGPRTSKWPITVTVFSEGIGLPNFRGFFAKSGYGIRVGTELYYHHQKARQVFQTLNVAYYHHARLQDGVYVSSEVGYRKFIGNAFVDGTLGLGALRVTSVNPRYQPDPEGFSKANQSLLRIMPALGLGIGYEFERLSFFSRYEMFGEVPFGLKGLPALPHKSLHLGARVRI